MKVVSSGIARSAVALAVLLFAGLASAQSSQSYFIAFAGAPGSIACTNTGFSFAPGFGYTWNLPPSNTIVNVVGTAGATVIQSGPFDFIASTGSAPVNGGPAPYASIPFPYTVKYQLAPTFPGASASTFSFDCASAVGTNFSFANGALFGLSAVPALDTLGLFALATLLGCASLLALRRRKAQR